MTVALISHDYWDNLDHEQCLRVTLPVKPDVGIESGQATHAVRRFFLNWEFFALLRNKSFFDANDIVPQYMFIFSFQMYFFNLPEPISYKSQDDFYSLLYT